MLVEGKSKQLQAQWEQVRWQEWHQTILSPYIKSGNKPSSPKAMMRFPWEEDDSVKREDCYLTDEQIAGLNKILSDLQSKKNGKDR